MAIEATLQNPIEFFRSGTFEMNCATMELSPVAEASRLYRGPGYIRLDEEGRMIFKIFPQEMSNAPLFPSLGGWGEAGKLLSAKEFYGLTATDAFGSQWLAEQVIPAMESGVEGVISANGVAHALTHTAERSYSGYYHELHFFEDMDFPCNAATHTYKDVGEGARLSKASNDLVKIKSLD